MNADKCPKTESSVSGDASQSGLCFGSDCFPSEAIQKCQFEERLEGNQIVKTSSAVVVPPGDARWDYHAETLLRGPEELVHGGICVNAEWHHTGKVEFSFEGFDWEFNRSIIRAIETFGMSELENAYWLTMLTGLFRGVDMPGLELDEELRSFLYAVPLKGLLSQGNVKSFMAGDFGVTSSDDDDIFNPLLSKTRLGTTEPVWQASVPKAWGIVLARSLQEAEGLALDRARFTADLINFSLSAGISHLETRYESKPLGWNASVGRSVVSLEPWIILREAKVTKGWIRPIPLIDREDAPSLEDGHERIQLFASCFRKASQAGDIEEQTGKRTLSKREQSLSVGVQRTLRWLGVAAREESVSDKFIATWISLEAILNAIDYPGVFEGERKSVGDSVRGAINGLGLPGHTDQSLIISKEMVEGRVLQNDWPHRTKLRLFARAFGVQLRLGDSELVRDLGRLRNEVLHAGKNALPVSSQQLRRLQYLVERLVVAASVHGYEDLEEESRHQLQFGEIGPMGGAAPLSLDGRDVSYTLRIVQDEEGLHIQEFVIEGKVYSEKNADISFAKEN